VVIVNDGSSDETGELAERFARSRPDVRVYHHYRNFGLGQAFRFAARHCRGDYVLMLDMDLSYSPDHIGRLLEHIRTTRAKIVLASPYMKGGRVSNVPWMRRTLSVWANRFLSASVKGNFSTLTSMVRVYDGPFLRSLNLRSMGMDVMPEVLYKARMLGARVEEIPAHLDWGVLGAKKARRRSSVRMLRHAASTILSGFLFRPVLYFIAPGMLLLAFALYVNTWMVIHFAREFALLPQYSDLFQRASAAVSAAYAHSPHTFLIGMLALMLAIQLISLGILALQSKSYFEEIFHLASAIYRSRREDREEPG
jgi:glycosyltransferase involved in cell wall biosynthesis